jgi:TetR/AcrR family transcriptional repressor of bet genes
MNIGADKTQNRDPKRNRQVLLKATLDSVAEVGIAETTVSAIIHRAGLSRGMIHLHFGGKDGLLTAAAAAFSDEYYVEMDRQLARTSGNPVEVILAIVRADLSPEILNERSVAIWHGLRGAARNNPEIARYSNTRDKRLRSMVCDAFAALLREAPTREYSTIANEVTLGTLALLEGMWADYMTHPNAFSRETAARIIMRFLNGIIPGSFKIDSIES